MIILDTNVLSEGMKTRPEPVVQEWLDAQDPKDVYLCAPVLAELHYGAELLPPGARRRSLERTIDRVADTFGGRFLAVDAAVSCEYGRLMAIRDRRGRATGTMDGLIAAIASVHRAAIATRDVHGFDGLGIELINPFPNP